MLRRWSLWAEGTNGTGRARLSQPRREADRIHQGWQCAVVHIGCNLPKSNAPNKLREMKVVVGHRCSLAVIPKQPGLWQGREIAAGNVGSKCRRGWLAIDPGWLYQGWQETQPRPRPELRDGADVLQAPVPEGPTPGEVGVLLDVSVIGLLQGELHILLEQAHAEHRKGQQQQNGPGQLEKVLLCVNLIAYVVQVDILWDTHDGCNFGIGCDFLAV